MTCALLSISAYLHKLCSTVQRTLQHKDAVSWRLLYIHISISPLRTNEILLRTKAIGTASDENIQTSDIFGLDWSIEVDLACHVRRVKLGRHYHNLTYVCEGEDRCCAIDLLVGAADTGWGMASRRLQKLYLHKCPASSRTHDRGGRPITISRLGLISHRHCRYISCIIWISLQKV